jgi:hypothetical protein
MFDQYIVPLYLVTLQVVVLGTMLLRCPTGLLGTASHPAVADCTFDQLLTNLLHCYVWLRCRLVLETDAPALGPNKAGVNVPANIAISCAEVSHFLGPSGSICTPLACSNETVLCVCSLRIAVAVGVQLSNVHVAHVDASANIFIM